MPSYINRKNFENPAEVDEKIAVVSSDVAQVSSDVAQVSSDVLTKVSKDNFIEGTFNYNITSVATVSTASQTIPITGAEIGDKVLLQPRTNYSNSRVSHYGVVTSPNIVTLYIINPSAATATLTTGTWDYLIIKQGVSA